MKPVIRVENISKLYRLGVAQKNSWMRGARRTLREAIMDTVTAPWRRFRKAPDRESAPASNGQLATPHDQPAATLTAEMTAQPTIASIWALQDISFEITQGEVVGIIGANGSGKSTLLKILAGIVEPTAGRAMILGRVGNLLEVGTGFHPDLTGRENIYLNGAILGMSRKEIDGKFEAIVDFSELHRFLDTPVKRYSSGMYVRLAFAVAAHLEPDVLLVDEVLAVGDAAFQRKCLRKIDRAADEGITVLFVSHDTGTVQKLCSRTLLLAQGKLQEVGESEKVIATYAGKSLVVDHAKPSEDGVWDLTKHPARFVGCDPMIHSLKLCSSDGKPRTLFYPGEPLHVEMLIEPVAPVARPRLAIAIEDHFGRRLTTLANVFSDVQIGTLAGRTRLRCTLPALRLGMGKYLLSMCLADKHGEILDALENAVIFEVGWQDDYYPGNEPYHALYGPILTDSTWQRLE